MTFITLIYFLFQVYISYRKKGWDISAYIFLLYATTSFFACCIVYLNPDSEFSSVETGLLPTLVYCGLITITILPLRRINLKLPFQITKKGVKLFEYISYFYIGMFFLMLVLFAANIYAILMNGDFYYMRIAGDVSALTSVNPLLRTILIAFGELSSLMLFFFFYSISYLDNSWKFNLLLFLSSLSMVLLGIMNIDRSRSFYWIIIFGLALTIFLPHLSRKAKRIAILMFSMTGVMVLAYFIIVSISRFSQGDSNVQSSLFSYAGQPYLQFCDFFNTYKPYKINFHFFFPNIYHFFIDGYSTAVDIGTAIEDKTGRFVNVFYTMLGSIMLDSGKLSMLLFVFLYVCIVSMFTKRIRIRKVISFWSVMQVFLLSLIPACGIISYYISSPIMALGFYALIGLSVHGNRLS